MSRKWSRLSTVALLLVVTSGSARAETRSVPMMRVNAETEVAAPPASVWQVLTSGKNLATWCPVWKSPRNSTVSVTKVGDVLDFTDQWGHGGRSIVTFFAKDRELRVAHEPNDGSYVCQARLTITPSAKGSKVSWLEQYTDESAAKDAQATAVKMQAEVDAGLAAVKKLAESEKARGK